MSDQPEMMFVYPFDSELGLYITEYTYNFIRSVVLTYGQRDIGQIDRCIRYDPLVTEKIVHMSYNEYSEFRPKFYASLYRFVEDLQRERTHAQST